MATIRNSYILKNVSVPGSSYITQFTNQGGGLHEFATDRQKKISKSILEQPNGPGEPKKYLQIA